MHCDDKRMLYVLKQEINQCWKDLENEDFENDLTLQELNKTITEYKVYKKSLK